MSISESDTILEELTLIKCAANGLNANEIKTTPIRFNDNVKRIEMFFSGFPTIMHLEKFPNLTILKVVAQELNQISGLETCLNLVELWICECKITKIEGLKNCRNLKKLFLYSNRLTRIQNLEQLNLDVLWLNDNKISEIEGVGHMSELLELNLAKNSIINIGNSLKNLRNLEVLNLSANEIQKFEEINYLQLLPRLKHLSFRDPQYGQNPITSLCNYSLYIMYLLPGLTSLDSFPIGQKAVKELADSTINKKKLWYYMKLTTTNRELDEMIERLEMVEETECASFRAEIKSIECKIRDLKKYSFVASLRSEVESKSPEPKESLLKPLIEKLNETEKKIKLIEQQKERAVKHLTQSMDLKRQCIQIELENGGNIRFEYYLSNGNGPNPNSVNEAWYKSCHDLILSRFCASDYVAKAINGIRVNKVIRVMNRALLAKYEEAFLSDVDENEYINNKPSLRKKTDYLFYCWRPKLGSQIEEIFEIIKNGFRDCSDYKKNGYEEAVPFTNSVSISDFYRIETLKNIQKSRANYNLAYKHGYALLCKVYINKFAQSISGPNSLEDYNVDKSVLVDTYPDSFGVRRPFKLENMNLSKSNSNSLTITQELFEAQRTCECKSKQTEYFLFKKELAVPEYIIEYEYNYKHHVEDVFEKELQNIRETNDLKTRSDLKQQASTTSEPTPSNIDDIVAKEIIDQIPNSPDDGDEKRLINLSELNLHNVGLTSLEIEPLKNLKHIKKLILSFNRIKSIKEINNMSSLEYLDASYNQIETLNGLKSVTKISYLDLSNNFLSDIVPLCIMLKQFFPTLTYLDLKDNRIKQVEKLRSLALYFLRSLVHYNKEKLSEDEKEFSDNKSRLNREAIKNNGHFIVSKPRSLRYYFVAELCNSDDFCFERTLGSGESDFNIAENSMTSFESDIDLIKDPNLFNKITTLNLDNQNLYRLSNIDFLVNLKWASFNNNFITKLEGIEKCFKLEELSLENNLLQSFNGLENLEQLRKVNLSNNEISDDPTKPLHWEPNLSRLVYLSVSKNRLTSLRFVLRLPALIELYASFNRVSNLREVFHLKPLNGLVILDLSSNPMCTQDMSSSGKAKYRLFVIYHLRALKSLDGFSIESGELAEARDCFGGKLTADFVAEKLSHQQPLNELRSLEFPSASIRLVELAATPQLVAEQFENLRSLNLENNALTSFSGIIYLRSLRLLSLSYNKIESIFPKSKSNPVPSLPAIGFEPILPNLEVLHLGYNCISDLVNLQVGRLTSLKALFLQGNEITKIEGLESLRDLRELVLDKNKIKQIGDLSFVGQSQRLVELHIEENRLRDLTNIETLRNLQKIFAANNKITDFADIDKLLELGHLNEISLLNNPISRRAHYRITIVFRLRRVRILDLVDVTDEDRIKAEMYFAEQMQQQQLQQQLYFNGGVIQIAPGGGSTSQTQPQLVQMSSQPMQQQYTASNVVSVNHLDVPAYFQTLSSSPRLKPISLGESKYLSSGSQANNPNNSSSTSSNTNSKKPVVSTKQQTFPARFRN